MNIENFWEELKRRKVVRVTLVYLAAAYAILESSDIILPRLGLPDWTVNLVMILLFVGLILVVILSWVYDITPEGIRVTNIVNGEKHSKQIQNLEGKSIANYEIVKKSEEGSLGVLYEGQDTALNRTVCITFLSDWICADKVVRARLIEKVQAAAGIEKEGMATIYSVEKENGLLFIVMEYNEKHVHLNGIPTEIEEVILEAIKDTPKEDQVELDQGEAVTISDSRLSQAPFSAVMHEMQAPRKHLSIPEIVSSKKLTIPIILIVIVLIIIFNWGSIQSIFGGSNKKRELAKSYVISGEEYYHLGNYEEAKAEFERALEADPNYSVAWSDLAAVCINQDNLNDAIKHTIKAVELDPKNFKAAYNLAYALDDKEDYIQAIQWYSKTIEMDSTFLPAYSALGRAYNMAGRPVEAILLLKNAGKIFQNSDSLYLIQKNLGYSHLLMDQIEESIIQLNASYNFNPNQSETNLYLAMAYESTGEITRSIEYWQQYISLETDTLKANAAEDHLQEITKKYLEEIIQE